MQDQSVSFRLSDCNYTAHQCETASLLLESRCRVCFVINLRVDLFVKSLNEQLDSVLLALQQSSYFKE